jgi:hypothetical protein
MEIDMKRRLGIWAACALLLCVGSAQAITADELVAKNIEARGGLDKIRAIQSLRQEGRMQISFGDFKIELTYLGLARRDGMVRTDASLQGLTAITAYDGKDAWQVSPFQGRKDPEKLSADQARELARAADIEGPLVDWKAKGHRLEYVGTEDVDGTLAHKLKLSLKDGDTQYWYLDPDYFLEIRVLTRSKVRGAETEQETDIGNYELVDGVYLPFSIESGPKGAPKGQKITIERVEANVEIDPAQFHFPTPVTAN